MATYDADHNKKLGWEEAACTRSSGAFSIGDGHAYRPNVIRVVDEKIQIPTWKPKLYYSFGAGETEIDYTTLVTTNLPAFETAYVAGGNYTKVVLGTSTQARSIWGYRLGPASGKHFVVDAVIHGNEHDGINGFIKAMELLHDLEEFQPFRDEWTLWFVPVINPDGYFLNTRNCANIGPNGNTINLNRNWDWFWGDYVESGSESKGAAPESEPEVAAFLNYWRTGNGGFPCNFGFLFDMHANQGPGARYQSRDRNWAQMDGSQSWPTMSGSEMEFDFQVHIWRMANALQTLRVRDEGAPNNFTRLYHSRFNPHLHSYFSSEGVPSMINEEVKVPVAGGSETYQSACNYRLDYIMAAAAACTSSWWESEAGVHIEPAGTNIFTNPQFRDWSSSRQTPQHWNVSRGAMSRHYHRDGQEEDSDRFYEMGERVSLTTDLAGTLDVVGEYTRAAVADDVTTPERFQALIMNPADGKMFHLNLNGTSSIVGSALATHVEVWGAAIGFATDNTVHLLGGGTAAPATGATNRCTSFTTAGVEAATGATLNTARMFMAYCDNYLDFPTAGAGERIWVFGGFDNGGSRLTSIEEWNPNTPAAANKVAVLPTAAAEGTAVFYPPTGKIYVFGGSTAVATTGTTTILDYDPVGDAISTHATSMLVALRHAAGAYCPGNGKIYIMGGQKTDGSMSDKVYSFNPSTGAYIEEDELKQDLDDEDEQDGTLRAWDVKIGRNSGVTLVETPTAYGELFMGGGRLVSTAGALTDVIYRFTPNDDVIGKASDVNYGYIRFNTKLNDTSWDNVIDEDFAAGIGSWTDPAGAWTDGGGFAEATGSLSGPLIVTTGPTLRMGRITGSIRISAATGAHEDCGATLRATYAGATLTDGYRLRYSYNGGTETWYLERVVASAATVLDSVDVSGTATSQVTTTGRTMIFEVGNADQAVHLKASFNGATLFEYFDVHDDRILTVGDAAVFGGQV
jgi:hypothetical protein